MSTMIHNTVATQRHLSTLQGLHNTVTRDDKVNSFIELYRGLNSEDRKLLNFAMMCVDSEDERVINQRKEVDPDEQYEDMRTQEKECNYL